MMQSSCHLKTTTARSRFRFGPLVTAAGVPGAVTVFVSSADNKILLSLTPRRWLMNTGQMKIPELKIVSNAARHRNTGRTYTNPASD